jgi:hypothetical protein
MTCYCCGNEFVAHRLKRCFGPACVLEYDRHGMVVKYADDGAACCTDCSETVRVVCEECTKLPECAEYVVAIEAMRARVGKSGRPSKTEEAHRQLLLSHLAQDDAVAAAAAAPAPLPAVRKKPARMTATVQAPAMPSAALLMEAPVDGLTTHTVEEMAGILTHRAFKTIKLLNRGNKVSDEDATSLIKAFKGFSINLINCDDTVVVKASIDSFETCKLASHLIMLPVLVGQLPAVQEALIAAMEPTALVAVSEEAKKLEEMADEQQKAVDALREGAKRMRMSIASGEMLE